MISEKVPTSQLEQTLLPSLDVEVPGIHLKHDVRPVSLVNEPVGQGKQFIKPVELAKNPRLHLLQIPATEAYPIGQAGQNVAPVTSDPLPASHKEQETVPFVFEYVPIGQFKQTEAPDDDAYVPGAHKLQDVDEFELE